MKINILTKEALFIIILLFLSCDEDVIVGCMNLDACNYDSNATQGNAQSCIYPEENYDCDGNCAVVEDCLGVCGGDAVVDECGECGGAGASEGACDCEGNTSLNECNPPESVVLSSPNYINGSVSISWDIYTGNLFDYYKLYKSNMGNMDDRKLIFQSEDLLMTEYLEQDLSIDLNEKKYYQLEIVNKFALTAASNIIEAHNWHVYNNIFNCKNNNYSIKLLNIEDRPYALSTPISLDINYLSDDEGIPMFTYDNVDYYHPIQICQRAINLLESYRITGVQEYLDRTILLAEKLIQISDQSYGDQLWFAYPFDFRLHGWSAEVLVSPWYSGMAQGQILSLFTRLYDITGTNDYLEYANKTYNTFTHRIIQDGNPWFVGIDGDNYLWLEEYPDLNQPNKTLNGFIFAIYGLYDYYVSSTNPEVLTLLQSSITTIQNYIEEFRVENGISYYCLTHEVASSGYHGIHIEQLQYLYSMTDEQYFYDVSQLFQSDH